MIKATALKINSLNKKKIFWMLTVTAGLLLGLYIFFITQTIVNTASYRMIEQNITMLDSHISELESKYISLKKGVDLNLTKTLGYVEASQIKFIDTKAVSQTLSLVISAK